MIGLSYVAFIDILGFTEMVIRDCESANPGSIYLPRLKSAIHRALADADTVNAKIVQFSDSIIVSSDFKPDVETFADFVSLVASLQRILFENGILCRGGVSHGRHFSDETLVFSQALIDAYRLETATAKSPRIVVSKDTVALLYRERVTCDLLLLDEDGEFFIDFMTPIGFDCAQLVLSGLLAELSKQSASVRSKVSWLCKYAHFLWPQFQMPENMQFQAL